MENAELKARRGWREGARVGVVGLSSGGELTGLDMPRQ